MPPKISFLKLTQTKSMQKFYEEKHICQDILVPIESMKEVLSEMESVLECWPIWVCPHLTKREGFLSRKKVKEDDHFDMYVDLGYYNTPESIKKNFFAKFDVYKALSHMEKTLRRVNGYQALYAVTTQSREEFREMFDLDLYESVRAKWGCRGVFMDVYDKIKRNKQAEGSKTSTVQVYDGMNILLYMTKLGLYLSGFLAVKITSTIS